MNAKDFLVLVGATLTAQQDYYALKRQGKKDLATAALIKAKGLEKRCWAIVNGGVLEPDEVEPTQSQPDIKKFVDALIEIACDDPLEHLLITHGFAYLKWNEEDDSDSLEPVDLWGTERPNVVRQITFIEEGGSNEKE